MEHANRQCRAKGRFTLGARLFLLALLVYLVFLGSTFEGYGQDTFDTSAGFARALVTGSAPDTFAYQGFYLEAVAGVPFYAVGAALDRVAGREDLVAFKVFSWNVYVALQAALAVVLVYALARDIYGSARTGLVVGLIYAFGTMTFAYSGLGHETMLCLALLVSLWGARRLGGARRLRWAALAGAGAGATAATKSYGVLFVPFLLLYFILVLRERRAAGETLRGVMVYVLCAAPFAAGNLLYLNLMLERTGSFPGGVFAWELARVPLALVGLYWSAGKGFFVYNLPLLLSIALAGRFWRAHRKEAIAFLAVAVYWSIFVAGFAPPMAPADEMWGARYLYPLIPLGALLLGGMVQRGAAGAVYAVLATVTTAASAFFQMLSRLWPKSYVRNIFDAPYVNSIERWQYMPTFSPMRLRWYILKAHISGHAAPLDYSPTYMEHHLAVGAEPPRWILEVNAGDFPPGVWWYEYLSRFLAGERSGRVLVVLVAAVVLATGAVVAGILLVRSAKTLELEMEG